MPFVNSNLQIPKLEQQSSLFQKNKPATSQFPQLSLEKHIEPLRGQPLIPEAQGMLQENKETSPNKKSSELITHNLNAADANKFEELFKDHGLQITKI